jgi:hypothetical protein
MVELNLHSSNVFMAWCSVKKKSTGTTLPLPYINDLPLTSDSVSIRALFLDDIRIITESDISLLVVIKP